ncbi:MAG TPA: type II toxin-antitoxin system VapC family toxin [Bryobacteraceae bacterium]|nr:type II toxin-antitoxin system VapC family toxin [Bryobacteraceae bacterium]
MKLLLDTHIWVRSQLNPERLSHRVTRAINDPRNELRISPISTWEIVLLCERGRLKLDGGPEAWIQNALTVAPLREAPLTHEIASATRSIGLPHRDPGDRLLVATPLVHGLTLVTADRNLGRSKQVPILLNH